MNSPSRILTAAVVCLCSGLFAQTGLAQNADQLGIFKNYFVTGDYVVGGWVKGASDGKLTTGTIAIPDTIPNSGKQPVQAGVVSQIPVGADIVAAYLYWQTVESTNVGSQTGVNGTFNGYAIAGVNLPLANPNAPTSWSGGGCAGNNNGSKTIHVYRADVKPYLPVDLTSGSPTFGNVLANTSYTVKLADTGTNGNTVPFTLGASLVIVYRVLGPNAPGLNSVVIYDGTFAPNNQNISNFIEISQTIQGFYQPDGTHHAKITHIVGDGQANKKEQVTFQGTGLNAIYADATVAFPGIYNGSWDNPTWDVSALLNGGTVGYDSSATTSVVASSSGSG